MSQGRPLVRTVTVRPAVPPHERARVRALLLGLRSRYVVPVLGVDEDDDGLVVRYDVPADVATLAARRAHGAALTLPEAVRVAADVAWGLAAGAATGVAHGRLDATQVVLGGGPARVLGLGVASLDAAPPPADLAVAPEVRAGGAPTAAADVWALGALLRDLLAGLTPPLPLADLLARMLDPQPSRRPVSARAVATRLVSLRIAAPAALVPPVPPRPTAPRPRPRTADRQGQSARSGSVDPVPEPGAAAATAPSPVPSPRRTGRRRAAGVPRPLALAVATAVLIAAGALVTLTAGGSAGPRRAAATPTRSAPRPVDGPSARPTSPPPAIPLPIVAATAPVDPVAAARLSRLSLAPGDVGAHARALTVPASSNFDAVLRALYAECDYFTPVGQPAYAHQFTGFVDGGVEVFDDLTTYASGVPSKVAAGVAVAIDKCPTIRVGSGRSSGAAEFAVQRIPAPPGVPTDAIAMTYTRTDEPDLDVRAVFLATGTTLRVVLALASSFGQSEPDWARAAARAWTRLADAR